MRTLVRWLFTGISLGVVYWSTSARMRAEATDRPFRTVMSHDLRTFVTRWFDPTVTRLGLVGGRVSPWAMLEHEGRVSGAIHRSPVMPHIHGEMMFIPLPYGTDAQWVRNVLVAGHCRVQFHEEIIELDDPTVVMAADNRTLSAAAHQALDETAVHYLRLRIVDRAPGEFAEPPHEFTTHRAPPSVSSIQLAPTAPTTAGPAATTA